ncbi:MAG TPA: aminomethyltransferase family protein [Acidimicrobiia bacterium]|nr:aminomethyltransferase family protein [Acidimicrobiia bacterium]
MIRHTPFHQRTSTANESGLWRHWSGYLVPEKYQSSDKFEYFAIRNSAAIIDTSPLFKYRITGPDAERLLAGALIRDIRKCQPGQAHYTAWCDDDGWVIEDGVVLRMSSDEFLLTTAEPNLAYFEGLATGLSAAIDDVSDGYGALAIQGPSSRQILQHLAPEVEDLGYFRLTPAKIGTPVTISRTGYTGDLGYEIWIEADDATHVWDRVLEAGTPYGAIPAGQTALLISRIEAGFLLLDVDYHSARSAWNDDQRFTTIELGLGWMLGDLGEDDRSFVGRRAIEREIEQGTSRWRTVGVVADWEDWTRAYHERGMVASKDHSPVHGGMMLYDDNITQIGYVTSFVYSPVLQRHIGIARVRTGFAGVGTRVGLEVTIDHRHKVVASRVARLPFYNPSRKTA